MNARSTALCALLLLATACSEPLEFAGWTVPVAEGTNVVEYAHVPFDARAGDRIEWVEELVISDRGDGERLFTGMAPPRSWTHAEGDFVWEIAQDPATTEYVIRKSRLVETFE